MPHSNHILTTYGRFDVKFVRGAGCRLWDENGKEYIDFMSGIGVNSVGHSHPHWVEAVTKQAGILAHVSNLYHTDPAETLAARLCAITKMAGVFFANSGAEANEGLIKLARKYSRDKYGENRSTIITLRDSFHGRTLAALTATGQDKFHKHFDPFVPGFRYVTVGDFAALEAQENDVCALLLEPIQGEGGVKPLDADYVRQAAALCKERDWLLLFDEVQTGIGRTGTWFGYEHFVGLNEAGLVETGFNETGLNETGLNETGLNETGLPDAVSFAKGIAGGLPLGGFIVGEKLKNVLGPGDHATTYGGNLICCAAANAVLDILTPILPEIAQKGERLKQKIAALNLPHVAEIRGRGLMLGIRLDGTSPNETISPAEINAKLLKNGLAALTAGTDVLRFMPPLVISDADIGEGLEILKEVL